MEITLMQNLALIIWVDVNIPIEPLTGFFYTSTISITGLLGRNHPQGKNSP